MSVLPVCMYVHHLHGWCLWRPCLLELESWMVVSHRLCGEKVSKGKWMESDEGIFSMEVHLSDNSSCVKLTKKLTRMSCFLFVMLQ